MKHKLKVLEVKAPRWGVESGTEIREIVLGMTLVQSGIRTEVKYSWYEYTNNQHPEYIARRLPGVVPGDLIDGIYIDPITGRISYHFSNPCPIKVQKEIEFATTDIQPVEHATQPIIGAHDWFEVFNSRPLIKKAGYTALGEEYATIEIFNRIRAWALERGIYSKGDPKTQALKLVEEVGELSKAILKKDDKEIVDGIGDCVVVLTNLAVLSGYTIEFCIDSAYKEISNRKGKMENGTFVKD